MTELGAARISERNVLTGEGRLESLRMAEITASAFPLTRVPALLGRPLQPTDDTPGAEPVVVLGYDVWQRQFLQDPAIIGRVVWRLGKIHGIRFDRPLPRPLFDHIRLFRSKPPALVAERLRLAA